MMTQARQDAGAEVQRSTSFRSASSHASEQNDVRLGNTSASAGCVF